MTGITRMNRVAMMLRMNWMTGITRMNRVAMMTRIT